MKLIYLILIILGMVVGISFVGPPQIVSAEQSTKCIDYNYKVNLNTAPATLNFYIGDELFKTVPSVKKDVDTELHCGHTYHVIISAEGYQTYEETYEVKDIMPVNPEIRNINLIKTGGEE